jgi:hypothetical protein
LGAAEFGHRRARDECMLDNSYYVKLPANPAVFRVQVTRYLPAP